MKKILNNSIALFVVCVILLLVIPLPPFMLDMMFIINIAVSLIILLMTMYIKEALEFSIFPSLLLITTLFRLGLNISSTRLILTKEGAAGAVIETFGNFVLQGNVVVGVIIFLIIVIVQFIVITKGAERVSEVAARFTLDAMPGKQMAIDADLSSGLITEDDARTRRYKIQKEADFYGAMDGATKIVKGDSIASIIITIINFIAGIIIGAVTSGMPFSEVLNVYSIATIGDGLVSQIPALLISVATGMIVTRAASGGSLNDDVSTQFISQPTVLIIAGSIMGCLIFIPGSPKVQPIILSAGLIILGTRLLKKPKTQETEFTTEEELLFEEEFTEEDFYKDINNVYSLLNVEAISVEFGYSLIPLVDEANGGNLISRIILFRKQYASDMGLVVPSVRLNDSSMISPNQYSVKIKGEEVAKGEILVDYFLALEPNDVSGHIEGIDTIEPAYGIPSKWITNDNKEIAEIYGYTVIDPLSVMMTHISEVIKKHSSELINRSEVMNLIENLKKTTAELVDETVPNTISFSALQKILSNLLKEGVPIKDLQTIFETIIESSTATRDVDLITENIRTALKRTITRKFCVGGQLKVVTLDTELEKLIVSNLNRTEQGVFLALNPDAMHKIVTKIGEYMPKFKDVSKTPIILTSPIVRVYFYRLIEQFYPNITVLSFNEIDNNIQIQALGNITVNS